MAVVPIEQVLALAAAIYPNLPEVAFLGRVTGPQKEVATNECIDQALDTAERIIARAHARSTARASGVPVTTAIISHAVQASGTLPAPVNVPPATRTQMQAEQLAAIMAKHGVTPEAVKESGGQLGEELAARMQGQAPPAQPPATQPEG